jgi:nicotinamide-nucleotide amidase
MAITDRDLMRLAARVGRSMLSRQLTVTTAESCTGGWIAKALTDIAGSSAWFSEGFVTYSNDSKVNLLDVPARVLRKHGAVSRATAECMAKGALRLAQAQRAVGVTGIAGPGGAVEGKPVGTVWLAWASRNGAKVNVIVQLKHFRGDRDTVRRKAVASALKGLLKIPD